MKIRVLQIIPTLEIGGAEKIALEIAKKIDKDRFQLTTISLYNTEEIDKYKRKYGLDIITFNKKRGADFGLIFKLTKYIVKQKPHVIHTHLYSAPYTFLGAILAKTPIRIHTVHSVAHKELQPKKRKLMKFAYTFLNYRPVAISKYVEKTIAKEYKIRTSKIININNGIDTKTYSNNNKKLKTRNNKPINIITVSRLEEVKNHKLMIDSFYEAQKNIQNIRLTIIGDGTLRNDIKNQIKQLKLENKINMAGATDEVANELKRADIYILTSKYEGLPVSVLEAMSSGLPIISTDIEAIDGIVINKNNGLVVPPNVKDISDAIITLATDDKIRKKFSNNSRIISQNYDSKIMVENYEKIYSQEKI